MDLIERLENILWFSLGIAIFFGLTIIVLESTIPEGQANFISFLTTLDATFFGLSTAIFVYFKQKKDLHDSLLKGLNEYLDYISAEFSGHETKKLATIKRVKSNYPNNLIQSNLFTNLLSDLIKMQSCINYYELISKKVFTESIEAEAVAFKEGREYRGINPIYQSNLDNAKGALLEQTKKLKAKISELK